MGKMISIHAPPRGATALATCLAGSGHISIHAPPRGATNFSRENIENLLFQFTPLREGRRGSMRRASSANSFQFTPLREGRRDCAICQLRNRRISIHAPPRGATSPPKPRRFDRTISIHAPPRGATKLLIYHHIRIAYFNSRPSARGDLLLLWKLYPFREFQFTPLREGRRINAHSLRHQLHFNSRPSARGDIMRLVKQGKNVISIHAPPRGATAHGMQANRHRGISIHAPPRGATYTVRPSRMAALFQFTPLREGRHAFAQAYTRGRNFNSRPSARGDGAQRA